MMIITAVGADRPGMAHAVASVLVETGCNIEDTTMTRLSGEFAMILIVSPAAGVTPEELAARLAPLEDSHGLYINCKSFDEKEDSAAAQIGERWVLSVYGPERSGLVAGITGVLASQNVNITDVQTRVTSGGALYVMIFELELPAGQSADELKIALETTSQEIGVQSSLHPLEEETL
jgi:glycine cleavage system transcriptional repressor